LSKQSDIREHLIELFEQTPAGEPPDKIADAVLWVLNEDGVVIEVKRELPVFCNIVRGQVMNAGYAFEPLIEDVHIQE